MRVLLTNGELRDPVTASTYLNPDGYSRGATPTAFETTDQLFGSACYKFAGDVTNTSYQEWNHTSIGSWPQTVWARAYFKVVDALPTNLVPILQFPGSNVSSIRLNSAGHVELWDNNAGSPAQIGSPSAYTVVVGRWFRLQLRFTAVDSTGGSSTELTVGDQGYYEEFDPHESISGSVLTQPNINVTQAGWITAPGATCTMLVAGVAVNNHLVQAGGPGNQANSWPGRSSVYLFKPTVVSSAGGWTDCSGGSNLHEGVNNTPPVGVADHTNAAHAANPDLIHATAVGTAILRTPSYASLGVNGPIECGVGTGDGTNGEVGSAAANQRRGQSFLVNGAVETFVLTLGEVGSVADDYFLDICQDSSGAPGAVLDTITIPPSGPSGTGVAVMVAPNVSIPGGLGTLWAVLRRSGAPDAANYYTWRRGDTADPYPDGTAATYDGTSWSNNAWDYKLKVNVRNADKIGVVMPFCAHGEGIATGTKAGSIQTNNPPMSTAYAFNFGGDIGAAGTYPTNWRWAWPAFAASPPPNNPPSDDTTKINYGRGVELRLALTSTTSSRAGLICSAGAYVEVKEAAAGWIRVQKTADSSIWWAKQVSAGTAVERDDGTILEVPFGSWIVYPDPQIGAGRDDFPSTTVAVTDTDFQAGYIEA